MSELKSRILEDIKTAMRARDKQRLEATRLISAAIKQFEVDNRVDADDEKVITILDKLAKQRRESIAQYQQADRQDLVDKENFELEIIQTYLPAQLSDDEIDALIEKAISETQASAMKDMGKVVGLLKPQLQGRADLAAVSAKIKARLAS